jgi:hypothetical protein
MVRRTWLGRRFTLIGDSNGRTVLPLSAEIGFRRERVAIETGPFQRVLSTLSPRSGIVAPSAERPLKRNSQPFGRRGWTRTSDHLLRSLTALPNTMIIR